MIDKNKILDIIDKELSETAIFLVDLKVSTANKIDVYIDGDDGVTIDECIELSRAIEGVFNRDEEDFELNVSSAGLDKPLKLKRQYEKNIGKEVIVKLLDGDRVEGQLLSVDDEGIELKKRNEKKKKNSENEPPIERMLFSEIAETKVKILF